VKILDLPHLPRRLRLQLPVIGILDGDPPFGHEIIHRSQELGNPHARYFGVFAVESGEIQSQVAVIWLTFTSVNGTFPVAGIENVATRPTSQRRGWAAALMEEVHRRESRRGVEWSFLWTHRSWGAHRLYEKLGYSDVYTPPAALKRVSRSSTLRIPSGYRWRVATRRDASRLDRIYDRATLHRLGFVHRFSGSFRARFTLGWRRPENLRILMLGSRDVGYVSLATSDRWSVTANEVVVVDPSHARPIIQALEFEGRNRWLLLETTTFVSDASQELRDRGFSTYAITHRTLMAKHLQNLGRAPAKLESTFQNPRFSNHRGDMFWALSRET
jgi:GNAT superfamily N-acetyltransferase